jgi:hypothetical protein
LLLLFCVVLDHFKRRELNQSRVVGTLVGTFDSVNNLVKITNSFPLPTSIDEESGKVSWIGLFFSNASKKKASMEQ